MQNSEEKLTENFPFEIKEANEEVSRKFPEIDHIFIGPKNYCFPKRIKHVFSEIYNFETRPSDVWILGYPRSGTTVISEIAWLLGNDLDYEKASETVMDIRFPVIENGAYFCEEYKRLKENLTSYTENAARIAEKLSKPAWQTLPAAAEKRFIKSHLPLSLAPSDILTSGCKVIYLARNPKDVCVSIYLLLNSFRTDGVEFDESFEKFWTYFRHGLVHCTPYFEHVKEAWEVRNHPNVIFLSYDNFTKDMKQTIRTLAKFLDKEISDHDVETLEEHVKIDNFRKNKSVNNDHLRELGLMKDKNDCFIRKGVIGGSKEYFQGHLGMEADNWIKNNLKDSDLQFLE